MPVVPGWPRPCTTINEWQAGLPREFRLMTDTRLDRTSLWDATTPMAEHPALAFNVRVNVAIVGGGVAGVTSAYLLKRLGQSVALVDAYQCGSGQTGRHAGHITAVPQFRMTTL